MADVILRCSNCQSMLDSCLTEATSGLGPPVYECRKCRTLSPSGRTEWPEMSPWQRLRYVGLSLVYAGACGFLGAGVVCMVHALYRQGPFQSTLDLDRSLLLPSGIVVGGVILLIQILRVAASIRRCRRQGPPGPWGSSSGSTPYRSSFWTAAGWTSLVLGAMLLTTIVGWVVSLIVYLTQKPPGEF